MLRGIGSVDSHRKTRLVSACSVLCLFLLLGGFFAGTDSASGDAPGELRITRITPSGMDVPAGRQIVFEFNRAVVPLGRMERSGSEVPITIEPALACQWRWLNASSLACQLDEAHAMAPATRYTITVRPGIIPKKGRAFPNRSPIPL